MSHLMTFCGRAMFASWKLLQFQSSLIVKIILAIFMRALAQQLAIVFNACKVPAPMTGRADIILYWNLLCRLYLHRITSIVTTELTHKQLRPIIKQRWCFIYTAHSWKGQYIRVPGGMNYVRLVRLSCLTYMLLTVSGTRGHRCTLLHCLLHRTTISSVHFKTHQSFAFY